MSSLALTNHAVEQFCSRWRPGVPEREAEHELAELAGGARPTRKRSLGRDAQLYVATTAHGERIQMLVRDGLVITVLGAETRDLVDHSADIEMYEESLADREAAKAAALLPDPPPIPEDRRSNAIRLIREVRAGERHVGAAALARAHNLLGIGYGDPLPPEPAPPSKPPGVTAEESRRLNAQVVINNWKAGQNYSQGAVKRAHETLGLKYEPAPTKPR